MAHSIADYALIGDCETAALVGRNGSIDWLCWLRFDSPACLAALLGTRANGYWRISPVTPGHVSRRYRPHSLILETEFKTCEGQITVIDFMPARDEIPRIIRIVRGDRGTVRVGMTLCLRFDYGRRPPSIEVDRTRAIAAVGRQELALSSSIPVRQKDKDIVTAFIVKAGQYVSFELAGAQTSRHEECTPYVLLKETERWWRRWTSHLNTAGRTPIRWNVRS